MTHLLLTVGKPKAAYIAAGLADYLKRLKRFGGCRHEVVRPERAGKNSQPAALMAAEAARLLEKIDPRDQVWALDRKGRALSSEDWARALDQARLDGTSRLALVIGGAEGLAPELLDRANLTLSMGSMVMAHEIAALVALEQLYRAHTILTGLPYHRGG